MFLHVFAVFDRAFLLMGVELMVSSNRLRKYNCIDQCVSERWSILVSVDVQGEYTRIHGRLVSYPRVFS